MKIQKTNAARILDRLKIDYQLIPYEFDENYIGAGHTAEILGQNIEQIFKTIVLKGDRTGVLVCVVPGNTEVDLKKAARVSGNKSVTPLPLKDLRDTTGYLRGGCSPIGMKKIFPTYINKSALCLEFIYISGGIRGMEIKIAPQDLAKTTSGIFEDLII